MLTRVWVHTLEGSMRAQSLLRGVSRMELPAPSTPWTCSPVHPAQPQLQRHPTNKAAHTHTGMLRGPVHWSKPSKQTKPRTKHTPEKWLIYPLLFRASSCGKFNQEQPEVSATHSQFHISTTIWLSSATTLLSYLNASTWRSAGDSRLKQHKKSQVLFNRALWGRQTHTLICWLIFQWCSLADRSAAWISFQLGIEHKTEHKNSLFFPSCPNIVINVLL